MEPGDGRLSSCTMRALSPAGMRPASVRLGRGDLLLFATDGIDPAFADSLPAAGPCRAIADGVLERHARPSDDALVLVVRYLGSPG